jgi:hypothetical protein
MGWFGRGRGFGVGGASRGAVTGTLGVGRGMGWFGRGVGIGGGGVVRGGGWWLAWDGGSYVPRLECFNGSNRRR